MKIITILQAAILFAILAFAASCSGVNQAYKSESSYPARSSSNSSNVVPLVISADAAQGMQSPDGRYYYRNKEGYIYWKGYNEKYYIDRVYANQVTSDPSDYSNWKKNHNR
jgi:hypothetical protein